jgi:hypothetical protein
MNKQWIMPWVGGRFGVFDAPDGDGAGASAVATPAATPDAPAGGEQSNGDGDGLDAVDAAGDAGSQDADLDDESLLFGDDDGAVDQRSPEEQIKALRARNRKLARRFSKTKGIADRFQGADVDDLITSARNFKALEQEAQRNPKLRKLLYGTDDDAGNDDRQPAGKSKPDPEFEAQFTAEALGFDPEESVANRRLAAALRSVAMMERQIGELTQLQPTVQTIKGHFDKASAQAERSSWVSAQNTLVEAIEKAMPGNKFMVRMAKDMLSGAFQTRSQHKATPQQVVDAYLQELKSSGQIAPKQAQAISAATQSRMAAHNKQLPKTPAGGGQPAGAQGNQRIRLADVHKRVRSGTALR